MLFSATLTTVAQISKLCITANKIEELTQLDFKSLYNCANKIEEVMQFIYYDITKHNRSIFL